MPKAASVVYQRAVINHAMWLRQDTSDQYGDVMPQAGATHEGLRNYFLDGQPTQVGYSSFGSPSEDCTHP